MKNATAWVTFCFLLSISSVANWVGLIGRFLGMIVDVFPKWMQGLFIQSEFVCGPIPALIRWGSMSALLWYRPIENRRASVREAGFMATG